MSPFCLRTRKTFCLIAALLSLAVEQSSTVAASAAAASAGSGSGSGSGSGTGKAGASSSKSQPQLKLETPKLEPALKSEKPMVDTSAPQVQTPPAKQSSNGYFIPPDTMNSGSPPGGSGGYGNQGPGGSFPPAPSEGNIPEFGKPLPAVQGNPNGQFGQGWGTGPQISNDEARVGRLEKSVLGSTYAEHDLIDRVEHLEEEVFKTKGSGPIDARLKKMETTVFGQSAPFGNPNGGPGGPGGGGSGGAPPAVAQAPGMPMGQPPPMNQPPPMSRAPNQMPPQNSAPPSNAPPSNSPQGRAPYEMAPYPSQSPPQGSMYGGGAGAPGGGMPGQPNYSQPYQGTPMGGGQPGYPPPQYNSGPPQVAQPPLNSGTPNGYSSGYGYQPPGTYPPTTMNQMPPNYSAGTPYNPGGNRFGGNGGAPYTPPGNQNQYGAPPQNYNGYRPPPNIPNNPNMGSGGGNNGMQNRMPPGAGQSQQQPAYARDPESQRVAGLIPADSKAGDYYPAIRKFVNGSVARWQHFPVLVHLPASTPESWRKSLAEDVKKWSAYIPLKTAADYESFVVDVKWENKLPPQTLGITRVEGSGAGLKVIIFLLRPTFYPADVPETTLQPVFLHELGHALGLYGHSLDPADVMYSDDKSGKKGAPKVTAITPRDLNTLKRVYMTNPIPDAFVIQPPLEYSSATGGSAVRQNLIN